MRNYKENPWLELPTFQLGRHLIFSFFQAYSFDNLGFSTNVPSCAMSSKTNWVFDRDPGENGGIFKKSKMSLWVQVSFFIF